MKFESSSPLVGEGFIKKLISLAKQLRLDGTQAERIPWKYLHAKQCKGFKFRRQQPIGRYIADFVCFEKKLIIELDGGQHFETTNADQKRDEWLKKQGFVVLRFWNNDIMKNIEGIHETIVNQLATLP